LIKEKLAAIGTNSDISKQYESKNTIDGDGKFIYPGLMRIAILQLWIKLAS
jgi:predicted amidohydrolase YtcJ